VASGALQGGAQLQARFAQGQLVALLLQDGRDREASFELGECLNGLAVGLLIPLHEVLLQHPGWLREQLAVRASTPAIEALRERLPAAPERGVALTDCLSGRELAVLELIAQGCSNQEISERLFISLHTVKSHARHINDKLGVERRTQAVARAKEMGLLR
ncbi:response regulator transcription factor, partial [Pseudomonas sp. Pseusp97]|uniref:response regulator transcription factor n=1 Tax=Pseudomonas sp. Pseusp97 TaxID=3243065 RepID=UPI0039A43C80